MNKPREFTEDELLLIERAKIKHHKSVFGTVPVNKTDLQWLIKARANEIEAENAALLARCEKAESLVRFIVPYVELQPPLDPEEEHLVTKWLEAAREVGK